MRDRHYSYPRPAWPVVALALILNGAAAQAQTPACGATPVADTTLTSDMQCAATAIRFIGAGSDNVTLDCAGFAIESDNESAIVADDVTGIEIRNCTITTNREFAHGIFFSDVGNSLVTGNTISANGDFARGIEMQRSSDNEISANEIIIFGAASNSLRLRAASNNNLLRNNILFAEATSTINIQSSNGNVLSGNTLLAPGDFVIQHSLLLHIGGLAIDAAGNGYAVENNVGSAVADGIGTSTAIVRLDAGLGAINSVMPLLAGASDVGFGFAALEVLPDGRLLALPDDGIATALYEIDPNSGQVTQIGLNLPPLAGLPNGLDAASNTSLLATTDAGELLNIDLTTGDVSVIGQQPIDWMDIALHPTNGRAYAVSRRSDEATGTNHLYRIDTGNGQVIAEIGDLRQKLVSDIDFAPDGTLYGINSGQIIVINTANASITQLLSLGPDPLEPQSQQTRLVNNLWQTANGSIQFSNSITLPTELETLVSRENLNIRFNRVKVDSVALPYLDVPARITLYGLSNPDRTLLVDDDDDGNFETCPSNRCQWVSHSNGTLIFDVTGFSTYSTLVNSRPADEQEDDPEDEDFSYGGALSPWMLMLLLLGAMRLRAKRG